MPLATVARAWRWMRLPTRAAKSAKEKPWACYPHRIEHDQVIAPEDFEKFKELGVIASVQPNHLLTDMNWAESHIGPERAKHSYPWKEFEDNGIPLAFGTDFPVEPITPFAAYTLPSRAKMKRGQKNIIPSKS